MIEAAMKHPENNYFMIVPDQFTMQTQKQMVKMPENLDEEIAFEAAYEEELAKKVSQ